MNVEAIGTGAAPAEDTKLAKAAGDFEALLLSELLKPLQESASLSDEPDAATGTAMGMAGEQFAQAIARRGGLGVGRLVLEALNKPAR